MLLFTQNAFFSIVILIISYLSVFPQTSRAQALNFKAHHYFPILDDPRQLKKGDFNRDGKIDIVTCNDGNISVLLNQGGKFDSVANYRVSQHALFSVEPGDHNGDGILDLFVSYNNDSIAVLTNSGDGLFNLTHRYKVGTAPTGMLSADYNNDGHADLAVVHSFSNNVYVFINTPSGFMTPTIYTVGTGLTISVGDFNNDGNRDLAVPNVDQHNFTILNGKGDGTFEEGESYSTKEYPTSIVVRDFDADGFDDVAIGYGGNNGLSVYKSIQNGFSLLKEFISIGSGNNPGHLAAGDFNRDSKPDLAILDYDNGGLSILINSGDGDFDSPQLYQVGVQPKGLISDDFNSDGNIDLAMATGHQINVLQNSGNATFELQKKYGLGYPFAAVSGDFNGDNSMDLAAVNLHTKSVSVLLNDQTGRFLQVNEYTVGNYPSAIKSGYLNDDPVLDLVVINSEDNSVSVLTGIGDGTFDAAVYHTVGVYPNSLSLGDFNKDAKVDIVTTNSTSSSISILLNTGNGFASAIHFGTGLKPLRIAAGDLNGDGLADLVTAYTYPDFGLNIRLNNGNGTFGETVPLPIEPDQIGSIEVRDFTFDGIPDVAVTCEYKFIIYPNNGVAGFATRDHYQIGSAANSISVGDFNADGKQDVAVASISSQAVNVLIADTATEKGYHEARYFRTIRLPLGMAAGNFNNDEKDDLVVVGWPLHYLSVFISLPTLTITARDTLRTYGASNPFFKSNVVGLKNNDPIEISYITPANTNSNIGEYEIVPVPDQVTVDNYAVVTKNGVLTITPAPLKITANDAARMYGEPNPDLTGIIEGLLNDDYVLVSYSTPAEENSPIGEYPIIPNLDWNGENYEPNYINGTLTITPVVGIETGQTLGPLNTYPNPSKGTFTINHAGSSVVSFEILASNGRIVSQGKLIPGPNVIEIEPSEGLYLIKFSNGTAKKVIIR